MHQTIRLKHCSRSTEDSYLHYILDFIRHHKQGDKDRLTMLPTSLILGLQRQPAKAQEIHDFDLRQWCGVRNYRAKPCPLDG